MASLYDLIMADEPTAQQQAAGLAEALRGQKRIATLGMLTGDKTLGNFGQTVYGDVSKQEANLGALAGERLRNALQQKQLELANAREVNAERHARAQEGYWDKLAAARAAADTTGGSLLSPEAQAMAARMYATTGNLPSMGMGKSGTQARAQVLNQAARDFGGMDISANKAAYQSQSHSLNKLQSQADFIDAFERTAMANLDQFLDTANKVVDRGSPLFNAPARKFSELVAGNPQMTQFNVARQVAVQEIGKVLSGAMGNAAISDSARHEVEQLLRPDASLAQIEAAAGILKRDMANRRNSMAAQLKEMRERIPIRSPSENAPVAEETPTAAPKPDVSDLRKKYGL